MNVDWCSTQLDHWSSRSILSINQQLRSKVLNQKPFYHFHQRIFNWRCQGFEFETFCPSFWAERAVPFHQAESTGGGGGSGKKISSCLEDGELPFARPPWRATGPGRQDKWPTRVILALQHCVRLLLLRGSSQQSLAVLEGEGNKAWSPALHPWSSDALACRLSPSSSGKRQGCPPGQGKAKRR